MTGLSEMFTTLNTAFSGFLSDVTSGTDIVTAFQTNLAPAFDGIWQQIITGLQNFIAMLPTYAPMVIQGAVGLFTGMVNGLAQVLPMLVQGLGTLIQSAVTTLPQWLPQVIQAAFNLFIGIATAVGNVLVNLLAAIASLIWGGISSFGNFVGDVISGAQELWNSACEGVTNTLSDFANAVGEVVQGGIDAVGDFIQSAIDAGANLINGFIDGVKNAAQGLIDAVGGAINDAIGFAKSLLGIASPSKVFAEIGKFTMQGMAIGIGEGSKDAAASMADAVSQIVGEADGIELQAAVEQVGIASVDSIMAGIRSTIDYAREQFQAILQELAQSSDFTVSGLSGLQLDEGIATTVDQTINFNQPVQSAYQVAQAMKRYSTYGLAGAR